MDLDLINRMQIQDSITSKGIEVGIPYSLDIDYITFSTVLKMDRIVASYKMYWLLAILDEVQFGNTEIEFRKLISRMIAYSWYPISAFKLSFGMFDNLEKVVNYISSAYNIKSNCDKNKLIDFIYYSEDKNINKMIKELTYNVPYRFLSPFFREEIKGKKNTKEIQDIITELSKSNNECIYEIYHNDKNRHCIRVRDKWSNYLKNNYKIIQGWTYFKLVVFLQKRNPNVPAIAMKLEAPLSRHLKTQTDIWKKIIQINGVKDLYTGLSFNDENYEKYGVLSMDHFIPWSFVLHDQMWNIVPTFKNINSAKNDNLLKYDNYIEGLSKLQYDAFCYLIDKNKKNEIEEYRTILRVPDANKFRNTGTYEEFIKRYKDGICPVYNIAANQGFYIVDNINWEK